MAPLHYYGRNKGIGTAGSGIPEVWLFISNHSNQKNLSKAMQCRLSLVILSSWRKLVLKAQQHRRLLSSCSWFSSQPRCQSCSLRRKWPFLPADFSLASWLLSKKNNTATSYTFTAIVFDRIPSGFTPGKIDWSLFHFHNICSGWIHICSDLPQEGPSSYHHLSGYYS